METFARDLFLKSYRQRQNWSLPDSLVFYITKNPSSAKIFQRLVHSCKYFFIKNPIIIIDLSYNNFYDLKNKELEAVFEKIEKRIILSNISYKFWVNGGYIQPTSKIISSIVPHLYEVDAKEIRINQQTISFNDFVRFSKNVENIDISYSDFKNENYSNIPLEKLVEALPKLKVLILYQGGFYLHPITSETMKELIKIEHFSKINFIRFEGLTDTFDIETFYDYMKKNKHTRFYFYFPYPLPVAFKNRLEEIVDEILETQNHDYKVPCFRFPYGDELKWSKMLKLFYSQ